MFKFWKRKSGIQEIKPGQMIRGKRGEGVDVFNPQAPCPMCSIESDGLTDENAGRLVALLRQGHLSHPKSRPGIGQLLQRLQRLARQWFARSKQSAA